MEPGASAMSDDLQTMTIDGHVHTFMATEFAEEANGLIEKLVEKGVPGKLRAGRSFITRRPEPTEDTRDSKRNARRANSLGIDEIWLGGEIDDEDRRWRIGA